MGKVVWLVLCFVGTFATEQKVQKESDIEPRQAYGPVLHEPQSTQFQQQRKFYQRQNNIFSKRYSI